MPTALRRRSRSFSIFQCRLQLWQGHDTARNPSMLSAWQSPIPGRRELCFLWGLRRYAHRERPHAVPPSEATPGKLSSNGHDSRSCVIEAHVLPAICLPVVAHLINNCGFVSCRPIFFFFILWRKLSALKTCSDSAAGWHSQESRQGDEVLRGVVRELSQKHFLVQREATFSKIQLILINLHR